MNKDRKYCTSKDCLTKTCSRHPCHLPKWYIKPLVWIDYDIDGCDMYKTMRIWKTLFRKEETDG